jgi:DNA sulfur modification protein DndE
MYCPLCNLVRALRAGEPVHGRDLFVLPFLLSAIILGATLLAAGGPVTIHMIGDSTMADKPAEDNPERGWGQLFGTFFDSTVTVRNHARNGRSTGSFIREGLWDSVLSGLSKGDYLVVQFGHNDGSVAKGDRYTPPDRYRANLARFVSEARARGALPILCTPVVRRRFDAGGLFYDTHGVYPDAVRAVADSLRVPLLDMHRSSRALVEGLGAEGSKRLFLHVPAGVYRSLPVGKEDDTHFSAYGAAKVAGLAADALREAGHPLAGRLKVAGGRGEGE